METTKIFGSRIVTPTGVCQWYRGERKGKEGRKRFWCCPVADCTGRMHFNGCSWLTYPAGNHHVCDKCGITLAIEGAKYA